MLPHFDTLLEQAKQQESGRRLLFTFARAEAGQGGTSLNPVMCVDRTVEEISSFQTIVDESRQFPQDWDVVFVASMAADQDPTALLRQMAADIGEGQATRYLAFSPEGVILDMQRA